MSESGLADEIGKGALIFGYVRRAGAIGTGANVIEGGLETEYLVSFGGQDVLGLSMDRG